MSDQNYDPEVSDSIDHTPKVHTTKGIMSNTDTTITHTVVGSSVDEDGVEHVVVARETKNTEHKS